MSKEFAAPTSEDPVKSVWFALFGNMFCKLCAKKAGNCLKEKKIERKTKKRNTLRSRCLGKSHH
jgi:hypothetical protein